MSSQGSNGAYEPSSARGLRCGGWPLFFPPTLLDFDQQTLLVTLFSLECVTLPAIAEGALR